MEDHYTFLNFSVDLKKDWYHSFYSSKPYSSNSMLLVQFSRSVVSDSVTPWTAAHQASLSITNSRNWVKLMSIESVMPSNHLILCHPFLLPSIFPSIRVFSNESVLCIRWPKYWSFSFSISPSNEYSGLISFRLISFRIDWLHLLAIQGTLKSLLQHHSSKASILRRSAFFTVQIPHPYITTGKTIALARQIFVSKVMSLLFDMLSRFVIAFLPRSTWLLPFVTAFTLCSDFGAREKKVCPCLHCLPIYMPWSDGAMSLVFWRLSFKPISGSTLRKTFYLGFNLLQKVNKHKLLQYLFLSLSDFCLPVNIFQQPAFIILIIILDNILFYIYILNF